MRQLTMMLIFGFMVGCNAITMEAGFREVGNDYSSVGMNATELSDSSICFGAGVSFWRAHNELNNSSSADAPAGSINIGSQGDETTEVSVLIGKKIGVGYLFSRISSYIQETGDVFEYIDPVTSEVSYYAPNTSNKSDATYGVEYIIPVDDYTYSIGLHEKRGLILGAGFKF